MTANLKAASKEACRIIRKQQVGLDHPNIKAYNDEYVIRNYKSEHKMFMDGFKFYHKLNNKKDEQHSN